METSRHIFVLQRSIQIVGNIISQRHQNIKNLQKMNQFVYSTLPDYLKKRHEARVVLIDFKRFSQQMLRRSLFN